MRDGDLDLCLRLKHQTINRRLFVTEQMAMNQRAMDDERDYLTLMRHMNATLKKVEQSRFYHKFVHQLKTDTAINANFSRVLGSYERMPMVVYGLNRIMISFTHKFRFALALLLRQDFPHLIESIEVRKTLANPVEDRAIRDFGCTAVIDEEAKMVIDKPTLFYLPYADSEIFASLFEENWSPSLLNQALILSNSIADIVKEIGSLIHEIDGHMEIAVERLTHQYERLRYVWAVQQHIEEYEIDREGRDLYKHMIEAGAEEAEDYYLRADEEGRKTYLNVNYKRECPFALLGWHFFRLACNANMEALLPRFPSTIKLLPNCDSYGYSRRSACKYLDDEDVEEATRLTQEIKDTMKDLEESDFYIIVRKQLRDRRIRPLISRVLGSEKYIRMVLFGIGSIEQKYESQYQFALALLLRQHSDIPIGEIEVFDSSLTLADRRTMLNMGCKVLDTDNRGQRIEMPTLFYLGIDDFETPPIFEANFCPSRLNQVIVLSHVRLFNGRHALLRQNRHLILRREWYPAYKVRYEWALESHRVEFRISKYFGSAILFLDLTLQFFVLDSNTDLHALLPRVPLKKKIKDDNAKEFHLRGDYEDPVTSRRETFESYSRMTFDDNSDDPNDDIHPDFKDFRWPSRLRSTWCPPPPGWFKLNFSGRLKGFGGVIHNDRGELLLSYASPLRDSKADGNVEALRHGIRCIRNLPDVQKLILEGDALYVINWANSIFPYHWKSSKAFQEIFEATTGKKWAFVHVYPEANSQAEEMAIRGAELSRLCAWEHEGDGAPPTDIPASKIGRKL